VKRGLRLVRFADDFLVLCKARPGAEAALEVTEELLGQLQLTLDPEKTKITSFDQGFRYLGHLFVRSLVLPSPNRLQRESAPGIGAADAAPAVAPVAKPAPRRLRVVTPAPADTALGKALGAALRVAGRESLMLAEGPAVAPPSPCLPARPR
jgi:hypothetical protein